MENPEIVLNLWYVYDDTGHIYSLRARCYIGAGTDDEKLALLRSFARIDYLIAQPFPIPERFHIRERFQKVLAARNFKKEDVHAGREYVKAYVGFVHYVEELSATARGSDPEHSHEHEN